MMIERKIVEIHRLSVRGWRRSGQIAVEVEGWRGYEAEWFEAMRGAKVQISDPGLAGPHNDKADYIVTNSSFDRKLVTHLDEQGGKSEVRLHHGTLDIAETWKSAWLRQRAEVLNLGLKLLLAPLFTAVGAGLALLWMDRPVNPDGEELDSPETAVRYEDRATEGAAGDDPAGPDDNDQVPVLPSTQTGSDTLVESNDSTLAKRVPSADGSTPKGGERGVAAAAESTPLLSDTGLAENEMPSRNLRVAVRVKKRRTGSGPYPELVRILGERVREWEARSDKIGERVRRSMQLTLCKVLLFRKLHGTRGLRAWIARRLSLRHAWRVRAARRRARRLYRESERRRS